jgi:large subunit ribosomal protein L4
MLKVNSYSAKGIKLADIALPKEWESEMNSSLLAQAVRVYTDRAHAGLRKAQTRAEVKRTTKKIYSQKGTGGARHGSRRAPIFVGGGVAHGPRPVSRELNLPLKMRRKATAVAMTEAVKDDRIVAASLDFGKTGEAQKFIDKVLKGKKGKVTFVIDRKSEVVRFLRNIKNVGVINMKDLNAYEIFFGGNIVLDKKIFMKEKKSK